MEKGSANSAPVLRSAFASCDSGVALRKSQITTERIYNLHKPLVQDPLPSTSVNLHAMFVGIKFKRSISPFYFQSTKNLSSTFKSKKKHPSPKPKIGPISALRLNSEKRWSGLLLACETDVQTLKPRRMRIGTMFKRRFLWGNPAKLWRQKGWEKSKKNIK